MTGRQRHLSGDDPTPDDPANDLERARASSFAERVEALVEDGDQPPAMAHDERALVEVAAAIRTGMIGEKLAAHRASSAIEGAFAIHAASTRQAAAPLPDDAAPAAPHAPAEGANAVAPSPRRRLPAATPWLTAALAAAAALFLAFGQPQPELEASASALPHHVTSRPADTLIGTIPRDRAADARTRADTIFADRLRGYRELSLSGDTGGSP